MPSPGRPLVMHPTTTALWFFEDHLTLKHPGLTLCARENTVLVFIESVARCRRLPYHKHRLVLLLSAMRHFAAEREREGWRVLYLPLDEAPDFAHAWHQAAQALPAPGEILLMEPNNLWEREALNRLKPKLPAPLRLLPNTMFLVPENEFITWAGERQRLLMENHYRRVRSKRGLLMSDRGPVGGRWNFDAENRQGFRQWKNSGSPKPPPRPSFPPDVITRAVIDDVGRHFRQHPGDSGTFSLAVTREQALRQLAHFCRHCLPEFGAWQDLMVEGEPLLFHSLLSPFLNIGLLTPEECVQKAEAAWRDGTAPLAAVEGFIRQIIGWREFVRGVYFLKRRAYLESNALDAHRPLPGFFWTARTEMACLRHCLGETLRAGFNHHIQRLMVLGNFLNLAGVNPGEAFEWFSAMYVDAHEWVMAANVIGMALHADGGFMATKPYVGAGAYISRMSNYCASCRYNPEVKTGPEACPFNFLYWAFYDHHAARFANNPRTSLAVRSWLTKPASQREAIVSRATKFLDELQ